MAQPADNAEREIEVLEASLKRLEAEYNMFFAGRLPRPPWETRSHVSALVKRIDGMVLANYGMRFRFTTLQTRFVKFTALWDRALRAREEGRAGPFPLPQAPSSEDKARPRQEDRVLTVATFKDPMREMEKVHDLYENVAAARRQAGQKEIPFHRFAELVKSQVGALKQKGGSEVAFRVAVKDGKVAVTARPARAGGKSKT